MAFFDDISKKITDVTSNAAQKTREMSEISKLNSAVNEEEAKINNAYLQIGRLYCANHSEDYEDSFGVFVNAVKESEKKIIDMKAQIREIKGIATCTKCGQDIPNNVAFCSFCGTPAPAPKVTVDPNSVFCPGCRAAVPKGMRFCTNCGYRMPDAPAQAPVQPPVQGGYAPQPAYVPEPAPVPAEAPQQSYAPQSEPATAVLNTDIDIADATRFVMEQEKIVIPDNIQDTYTPARAEAQQLAQKTCSNCGKALTEGMVFCTECGARV